MHILSVILIDCVAKDDDECLADTTYFTGSWANCTKAKESCSDWSKDLYRCCPQTCGIDRLDDSQCHALEGKGKCIYPMKNQCLEPRKYLLTIWQKDVSELSLLELYIFTYVYI